MSEGFSHYVVRRQSPARRLGLLMIFSVAMSVAFWFVFDFGRSRAGFDAEEAAQRVHMLELRIKQLTKDNVDLSEKAALLERSNGVDREAYGKIEKTLRTLQDENYALKQQSSVLQSIVGAGAAAEFVKVQQLKIKKGSGAGKYRYRLALMQTEHVDRAIKGSVTFALEGLQGGADKVFAINAGPGGKLTVQPFSFRHFQNLDGDFVMPQNFEPQRLKVSIDMPGKSPSHFEKIFTWSDVAG